MNVAILICGQPRMLDFCLPKIKNVFDTLEVNLKYFVHSYNEIGIKSYSSANPKATSVVTFTKNEITEKFNSYLPVEQIVIEDYSKILNYKKPITDIIKVINTEKSFYYSDIGSEGDNHYLTWMGAMYSAAKANELKKEYENNNKIKFNVVIKLRTDIVFHEYYLGLRKNQTQQVLLKQTNKGGGHNQMYVTYIHSKAGRLEVGDFIKWGPSESFDVLLHDVITNYYELCIESIQNFIKNKDQNKKPVLIGDQNTFSPESQWAYLGIKNNISFFPRSLGVNLVRPNVQEGDSYETVLEKNNIFMKNMHKIHKEKKDINEWLKDKLL